MVDWETGKSHISSLALDPIKERISVLRAQFEEIIFYSYLQRSQSESQSIV
jgi:hypothetical protein